jgi:hypothetical protein
LPALTYLASRTDWLPDLRMSILHIHQFLWPLPWKLHPLKIWIMWVNSSHLYWGNINSKNAPGMLTSWLRNLFTHHQRLFSMHAGLLSKFNRRLMRSMRLTLRNMPKQNHVHRLHRWVHPESY